MSVYNVLLIIFAMGLAGLSNIHICIFLVEKKWGHDDGNGVFIVIASTIATPAAANPQLQCGASPGNVWPSRPQMIGEIKAPILMPT